MTVDITNDNVKELLDVFEDSSMFFGQEVAGLVPEEAFELYKNYISLYKDLVANVVSSAPLSQSLTAFLQCECKGELTQDLEHEINEHHLESLLKIQNLKDEAAKKFLSEAENQLKKNELSEALETAQKVLFCNKGHDVYKLLGRIYFSMKNYAAAEGMYKKALRYKDGDVEVYIGLGDVSKAARQKTKAIEYFEKAYNLQKDNLYILENLGLLYAESFRISEGIAKLEEYLDLQPQERRVLIHYAWRLCQVLGLSQQDIKDKLTYRLNRYLEFEKIQRRKYSFDQKDRDKTRKLRIGYISSNFWNHVMCMFILPIFENYNKQFEEVYLYSMMTRSPDAITDKFKHNCTEFVDCSKMSEDQVADRIYNDKIDILIDLNGYTFETGMFVLARKPAPIQCIYMDYQNTTCLDEIDYILADKFSIPENESGGYSEKPAYIERGYACYKDYHFEANKIKEAPCKKNGFVTFGCYANLNKLSDHLLAKWAKIVKSVDNSQIKFCYKEQYDASVTAHIQKIFEENGVSNDRVITYDNGSEYKKNIFVTDICLDTEPFSGMTTSCNILNLGIPIITQKGWNIVSRITSRIYNQMQFYDLIAENEEDYIKKAVDLANDWDRIQYYRDNLSDWFQKSPICDYRGFAKSLENTYQKLWNDYCSQYD